MGRLPGEEGRKEAKKPPPAAEDLLDRVGDKGVVRGDVVELDPTALMDGRRPVCDSRAGLGR